MSNNEIQKVSLGAIQPNRPESSYLTASNFDDAWTIANMLADSDFVPKDYRGKPANIMASVAMGKNLGLDTMQSLINIAVINGRPSLWGKAFRALIQNAPDLISFEESYDENTKTAYCHITKRLPSGANATFTGSFSFEEAKTAGLTGKDNYQKYLKRMLKARALGFAGGDAFPDRLTGLALAEESEDIAARDITPAQACEPTASVVIKEVQDKQPNSKLASILSEKLGKNPLLNIPLLKIPLSKKRTTRI